MSNPEPSPAVIDRLDEFLRTAGTQDDRKVKVCAFLQGMFGFFMSANNPWPGDDATFHFSNRVIAREGGLTMANFLAETQSAYGSQVYNELIAAINNSRFSERLDKMTQ